MIYMGSFAGTNHPMYILYTGSKMKVETLLYSHVHEACTEEHLIDRWHNPAGPK